MLLLCSGKAHKDNFKINKNENNNSQSLRFDYNLLVTTEVSYDVIVKVLIMKLKD